MSDWNHVICDVCWSLRKPDSEPARVIDEEQRQCCYCGQPTQSGIFYRDDPKTPLHCKHRGDE